MEKVPDWLSAVTVEFVCNSCPNRKVRNIASVTLEPEIAPTSKIDTESLDDDTDDEDSE